MPNFDDITKILALIGTIAGGGVWISKWFEARRKTRRSRHLPSGDFPFEVFKPSTPNLLKEIMGGDENNALADYKIPYQERQPDRNVCQELEAVFTEKNKNWVLVLGKSGLGKTREAAHLAELLNREGWTVLKLAAQPGEWLDVPKEFPSEISPDDKLLFFLDDLNRWMYWGIHYESHPKAREELARPLREPVQERLPRLLKYFEDQGKLGYVRVIAMARDEREPDKPGDISPRDKLQWEKYKSFWQQFHPYSLMEPSEGAIVNLLTDCVAAAGLRGVSEEYGRIARRNDGTFRNITLNLGSAQNRGLAVNNQEFSPKLDQTWRQNYRKAVERYPLAVYAYDAVELLRSLNLWLTPPMLEATTKRLLPGRGVRRWRQEWQLRRVLDYLITTEQILKPKDGQIEAKNPGVLDVGRYVPAILQQLGQMVKQDPTYPVAAECFKCGNALHNLSRYEDAIASYDKALKYKPDYHKVWFSRGNALTSLDQYEAAIASYDKALKYKPDYHKAWFFRGNALTGLDQHEAAIASYDKALKYKPDYHEAWFFRGNALTGLDQYEAAIASYDKALERKPDYHPAWFMKGRVLDELGRKEEAIVSYEKALEYKLDYHEAWSERGVTLSELGRKEEAMVSYDKALELEPNSYEDWVNRGVTLSELGHNEEAIASYDRAIDINPEYHFPGEAGVLC